MTRAQHAAAKERESKATPGPWTNHGCIAFHETSVYREVAGIEIGMVCQNDKLWSPIAEDFYPEDAEFVAHARTDLKDALDMLERAARIIESLDLLAKYLGDRVIATEWLREWNSESLCAGPGE